MYTYIITWVTTTQHLNELSRWWGLLSWGNGLLTLLVYSSYICHQLLRSRISQKQPFWLCGGHTYNHNHNSPFHFCSPPPPCQKVIWQTSACIFQQNVGFFSRVQNLKDTKHRTKIMFPIIIKITSVFSRMLNDDDI